MKRILYLILFIPLLGRTQSISITTASTTVCQSTITHFTATATGTTTPHYLWKVNGTTNGADSINFSTDSLHSGDTVSCQLVTSTRDTVIAASNKIIMRVDSMPDAGIILGPYAICAGTTDTFRTTAPGGTWSTVTGNATVDSFGVVTGVHYESINVPGFDSVYYTLSNACGSSSTGIPIEVDPPPYAGFSITSGYSMFSYVYSLCVGQQAIVDYGDFNGYLTSKYGYVSITFVPDTRIEALTPGQDTLINIVTNACGTARAIWPMLVLTAPTAIAPITTSANQVCVDATLLLNDSANGSWSVSNANATVNSSGLLTGKAPGIDTVHFTIGNMCGNKDTFTVITVNGPASINAKDSACAGTTIRLTDNTSGGTWTSSNAPVATVDQSGNLTCSNEGIVTINYSYGSCTVSKTISVNSWLQPISGPLDICVETAAYFTHVMPNGVWSTLDTVAASIDSTGKLFARDTGSVNITYRVKSGCAATMNVYVKPPLPIQTDGSLCQYQSMLPLESVPGGAWSVTDTSIASIDSKTGLLTGKIGGICTIMYEMPNGCHAQTTVTVNAAPRIQGEHFACAGTTITLIDTGIGSWVSSDKQIATINDATGKLTGIEKGITSIFYKMNNGCYDSIPMTITNCNNIVMVFPNPATDKAVIYADTTLYYHYTLYDMAGRRLTDKSIAATFTEVNTQMLPAGLYLLVLTGYDSNWYTKLIKN